MNNALIKDILQEDINKFIDYVSFLETELKAYENMRKEAIELINIRYNIRYKEQKQYDKRLKDLLNILNKVGGSDE